MISLRGRIVRRVTSRYFKSINAHTADVQAMRRGWHKMSQRLPVPRGIERRPVQIASCDAEWLDPPNALDGKVLLYFHGGAYLMGSCTTHRSLVSQIARASGMRALVPEYRLAPEHPYPAAIEDATAIYKTLLADGYSPEDIVVGGDSVGGGLTMAMLLTLRNQADPLPGFIFLLSPWLDLTGAGESMRTRADHDPWFQPDAMHVVAAYYCSDDERNDPRVSPVYADLHGLPPIFIQVGEDEILLSDSTRLADGIKAVGGDVEIEIWPGMWHVFQMFAPYVPEAKRAIAGIACRMTAAPEPARV